MISIYYAILAGASLSIQNSINGLMSPFTGALGISLAGFAVQTLFMIGYQFSRKENLTFLRNVPILYYGSGLIGTFVVGFMGICVSQMGSSVTQCCSVSGQILMSAVVDHIGLFGTKRIHFTKKRIPGLILIISGVLTMNLIGKVNSTQIPLNFIFFGMSLGAAAVVARTLNYRATQYAESAVAGGIVNSIGGFVSAFVFYSIMAGFRPDFSVFTRIPVQYYFAGVFGSLSCIFIIKAYFKENVFYATVFMLVGQILVSILIDAVIFHALSLESCIGIVIVMMGVFLDKKSKEEEK